MKDYKDNRLSFIIPKELDKEVDKIVLMHENIRNRSDFGTKAILTYIEHLKQQKSRDELILQAIKSVGDQLGIKLSSVETILNTD
ncbi:MAG: ribbon-helix-helix domain-containing protein [Candidatus Heimdallarchaeota archaeon]|nr:ribbon-helix-helix domain-containing protein [Candidatus Heimdallarchaeota archaeon]MDH5647459.1 ribbon-helix-helix domain-containing protein [Candidatus Heimdallarchaeota archaeon]